MDLDGLDAKIAKLEAKEKTATGKARDQLNSALPAIRAQRASFGADFRSLLTTSTSTWDATKDRLDKEWKDLSTAVDNAS